MTFFNNIKIVIGLIVGPFLLIVGITGLNQTNSNFDISIGAIISGIIIIVFTIWRIQLRKAAIW